MTLGTFTFPNDPESLRLSFQRKVNVETSADGTWSVTDKGAAGRVFDCEGVFYGDSSYASCKSLAKMFIEGKKVSFAHPKWDNANVLLTELEIDEECKDHFLRYRLQLVETP